MTHAPYYFVAIVVYMHLLAASGDVTIKFDSPKNVFIAERHLRNVGLPQFMDQVWAEKIDAPGIHSKYWVYQFFPSLSFFVALMMYLYLLFQFFLITKVLILIY